MLLLSFEVDKSKTWRGPLVIVLILEKENLDRMHQADPIDVRFTAYAQFLNAYRPIRDVDLVIAYEEDTERILRYREANDIDGLMAWLERGRKVRLDDLLEAVPLRRT